MRRYRNVKCQKFPGGGYTVEEYEALKTEKNHLKEQVGKIQQAHQLSKLRFGTISVSNSTTAASKLDLSELASLGYISSSMDGNGRYTVYKPFIMQAAATLRGSSNGIYVYMLKNITNKQEVQIWNGTNSVVAEMEFSANDKMAVTGSSPYGTAMQIWIAYRIINPILLQ